jgi:hypothetical protein
MGGMQAMKEQVKTMNNTARIGDLISVFFGSVV